LFQVGSVFVIGLAVVLWNAAVLDYTDFSLVTHPGPWSFLSPFALKLSSIPFTISSPSLGLLLVFRTNASYSRWLEGQRAWGRISSYVTNTVRHETNQPTDTN
jgi:predicted membrane chloride channel (bestrophin family)